jgi:hypothetical protein
VNGTSAPIAVISPSVSIIKLPVFFMLAPYHRLLFIPLHFSNLISLADFANHIKDVIVEELPPFSINSYIIG